MEKEFDLIRKSRENFLNLLEDFSLQALNEIPAGFNNNLIWNFAHSLVSMQILCYRLSGLAEKMDITYIIKYCKGSKPESFIEQAEVDYLKSAALATLQELALDWKQGLFTIYKPYETSFGVSLGSIEEAIRFNAVHEGLHLGYAMALKNSLNQHT